MHEIPCSWLSPKLESRTNLEKGGNGVYAIANIQKDELIAMFGGSVMTGEEISTISETLRSLSIQIEENLYLVTTVIAPADHINHSCEPNVGIQGQVAVVAMRDITIGEEISFDYAMSDSSDYDEFDCACGAENCRGKITGNDWKLPELWGKYEGFFSHYLARKISALKQQNSEAEEIHN